MEDFKVKVDGFFKGIKTYFTTSVGAIIVIILQSQDIDAVGMVDTIQVLVTDAVVQVTVIANTLIAAWRKVMPDKRDDEPTQVTG